MALALDDIFKTDPEAESKSGGGSAGLSATMHGGFFNADTNSPATVQEWLFRFDSEDNATAFAQLFGGQPNESEADREKEMFISLFSGSSAVEGVLTEDDIKADMRLYVNGTLTHHCTGSMYISHPFDDSKVGTPCDCPADFEERKQRAKLKVGPAPYIDVFFSLADDTDMRVKYHTGSWTLVRDLPGIVRDIARKGSGGEVLARLELEPITTKKGKSFILPRVRVLKAWNEAVADDAA